MRPGTPFWASIRTQVHPTVMEQARAGGGSAVAWTLEPEQIQLLAYHAIASGARGLWFRSESRLDATDRQTVLRAKTLEWLNLELQMFEAWAATGTHETELATGDPACAPACSRPTGRDCCWSSATSPTSSSWPEWSTAAP